MWMLLILVSLTTPTEVEVTGLNMFVTKEACQVELKKVTEEFAKVFPFDQSYAVVCVKQRDKEA